MIFGCSKRESIKMRHRLNIAYMSLLLISLFSSCLLFLIVASEAIKPNSVDNRDTKFSDFTLEDDSVSTESEKDTAVKFQEEVATGVPPPQESVSSHSSSLTRESNRFDGGSVASGSKSEYSRDDKNTQFGKVPNVVENINEERFQAMEHHDPSPKILPPSSVDEQIVHQAATETTTTSTNAADADKEVAEEILPDIPVNPAVITFGDKAPELVLDGRLSSEDLEDIDSNLNGTDDESSLPSSLAQDSTVLVSEPKTTKKEIILPLEVSPDEPPPKIDDSGGGTPSRSQDTIVNSNTQDSKDASIPVLHDVASNTVTSPDIPIDTGSEESSAVPSTAAPEVNLTVEENPIPVFSEWAQKQMEEAEKKLEKEVVSSQAMKKNSSTENKKQPSKLRAKNYASPDCGAKIIASNSDSQNTGALLSSTKDEYMLSPCTNRIWFVVELCEAIQAEKIELANFELFSSSPKNFSVFVSTRFPTREWSNVGRFIASDQRNIQSFELYPHLFGKFVRVDIHSHYNSEHFCPISLFRVYGTSEFEAFETENRLPADDMDDFDDEDVVEAGGNVKNENNLFKSASDAVMSIVKKAAEVLVKTNTNKTDGDASDLNVTNPKALLGRKCSTLRHIFSCNSCGERIVNRTNYLLSCRYNQLVNLLSIEMLRTHILTSQICAKRFNLDTLGYETIACTSQSTPFLDEQHSFILNAFPLEYLAALCHILVTDINSKRHSRYGSTGPGTDSAMNLTIDQKPGTGHFVNIETRDRPSKQVPKGKLPKLGTKDDSEGIIAIPPVLKPDSGKAREEKNVPSSTDGKVIAERGQETTTKDGDATTSYNNIDSSSQQTTSESGSEAESKKPVSSDVNIFNIVDETHDTTEESVTNTERAPTGDGSISGDPNETPSFKDKNDDVTKPQDSVGSTGAVDIEPTAWDNIDNILNEQVGSESVPIGSNEASGTIAQQAPQRVHSESVFLRLSNRVKALERNMSLSGQYLEELSRRYKKQVEELQHSFAKTLASIDEQNRRALEKEQILITQNRNLKEQLDEISNRLNNWIIFGICFFFFLMFQTFLLWLRSHRENRRILRHLEESSLSLRRRSTPLRKLPRQKSVEGVSGHPTPTHKVRRPSEEADRITGSYKNLLIYDDDEDIQNIDGSDEAKDTLGDIGKKSSKIRSRKSSSVRRNGNLESKVLLLSRQESAPGDFIRSNVSSPVESHEDDKSLLEDDYESYVPGTDLAYNEFMPEGPSGSHVNGNVQNNQKNSSKKSSKVRRLSSPSFLKSTFSRSGSTKKSPHSPTGWEWYRLRKSENKTSSAPSESSNAMTTPPSSQRVTNGNNKSLKKSKSESPEFPIKLNGFGNGSSTPNSSISTDILATGYNHTGSDESIRTSDTSLTTATTGSILTNGNRRNSSSKKQGSFRRMLKKVF